MAFPSLHFAAFFAVFYVIYWWLPHASRRHWLLLSSYAFYAFWDTRFVAVLALCSVVDYTVGAAIAKSSAAQRRRGLLLVSLTFNLGVLAFFKYFNFFAATAAVALDAVGLHISPAALRVALPIGISFYTFRSLSYTLDIYRGQLRPARSLLDYAVFVAFFPLLGAGPIVRARHFLPQLAQQRALEAADLDAGLARFFLGLCKKVFIADTLGFYLVDPVFAHPASFSPSALWLALFGYSIQIYADFSGYSSMAIGISRALGFKIGENFKFPYLARGFSDFWKRWHISLTTWLRDYLWWSVASRTPFAARLRWSAALVFVFVVSGLWHGAGWTFVVWGGIHGVAIATNQQWRAWCQRRPMESWMRAWPWTVGSILVTYLLVSLAWVLFRCPDFGSTWLVLRGLLKQNGPASIELPPVVYLAFAGFVIDHAGGWLLERKARIVRRRSAPPVQGFVYAALLVLLWLGTPDHATKFIYFQF